ncbi:MAG TPA: aspartyl protease family protein [Candidatus Aquilonibacter sp.]
MRTPHCAVLALAISLLAAATPAPTVPDAATLFRNGDFAGAAAAYQTAIDADAHDSTALTGLGAIRLYQNDLAAAEPLLRAAIAADPSNTRAPRLLTELQRRQAESVRRSTVDGGETTVPFIVVDPLPVVHVVANGQPANFVIDTGGDVDLEPDFAERVGVKTEAGANGTFAGGKQAPMRTGMLASLSLGGATADDVPVHVLPLHAESLFPNVKIDGLVGTTYFERFLVTMDYPHKQLILRPRSASAAFQVQAKASGATIEPCLLVGDHLVVATAQVNDAPPGPFVFDSGFAGGGVAASTELVKAAGIALDEAHAATVMGGGGAFTAVPFVAKRVTVGNAVVENVRGAYNEGQTFATFPFTVWGMISNEFLRHFSYTVDFDAMTMVLAR